MIIFIVYSLSCGYSFTKFFLHQCKVLVNTLPVLMVLIETISPKSSELNTSYLMEVFFKKKNPGAITTCLYFSYSSMYSCCLCVICFMWWAWLDSNQREPANLSIAYKAKGIQARRRITCKSRWRKTYECRLV